MQHAFESTHQPITVDDLQLGGVEAVDTYGGCHEALLSSGVDNEPTLFRVSLSPAGTRGREVSDQGSRAGLSCARMPLALACWPVARLEGRDYRAKPNSLTRLHTSSIDS